MTIGFLLDDGLDRPDGVQQYILALGEWFTKHGHTVHYLVGQTERSDIANVHSLSRIHRVKFNANVVGTPLPANKRKIRELLSQLHLDVLHVQVPYSPLLAGRVITACDASVAVVGTLHVFPNSLIEHGLNKLLTGINGRTLRRFDEIVAVSQVAAKASHLPQASQMRIIPNPVSLARYRPLKPRKRSGQTVVFLGRLVKRKGCQLLLTALAQMKEDGEVPTGLQVVIGGDGHLRPSLEAYVSQHGLKEIVTFRGFIDEDEKPAFLQAADVAVYPSSGGESFGIVLIEAMAAGAVTLGGNNPGYAGVLQPGSAALFNPRDPEDLRRLLTRVVTDTSFYAQLQTEQQKLVKQFDIEKVASDISEVYAKALHHRHNMA